jgi:hypothetical protein
MNPREQDIFNLINIHGPLTSAQLQEYMTEPRLGYNIEVKEITKIVSKMKSKGLLSGKERPNPGTKPMMYWGLPEAAGAKQDLGDFVIYQDSQTYSEPVVNPDFTTEMASDVAEVEQAQPPAPSPLVDCLIAEAEREPELEIQFNATTENTAWKRLLPSKPMSAAKIQREFANCGFEDDRPLGAFLDGIAAAERHHGISE